MRPFITNIFVFLWPHSSINKLMAKKKETVPSDDILEGKADLLSFIDIFRKAIQGNKFAVKIANRILDEWEEECENLPNANKVDDNLAFLPHPANEGDYDDDYLPLKQPNLKRPNVSEYHLRIKLNDTKLKIWRELKVPSNLGLDFLGHVLIDIMGWEDEHLFQFTYNKAFYSDEESVEMSWNDNVKLMSKFALSDLLKEKGDRMMFEYDFGDNWRHDVWLKGIRPYEKDEKPRIELVKGEGACPPEDCGGVPGYERLLELAKKKRKSAEEKEELEWYGIDKHYDPNDPDIISCQEAAEEWDEALREK